MTPKMKAFVEAVANGLSHRDAGITAGYSRATVDQAVSRLVKHPDVKKALAKARRQQAKSSPGAESAQEEGESEDALRCDYENSMAFMRHAMNNPKLPRSLRFEAAKQLLPYEHARLGEKGKKAQREDDARSTAKGKFSPKTPPRAALTVVK